MWGTPTRRANVGPPDGVAEKTSGAAMGARWKTGFAGAEEHKREDVSVSAAAS